jgi:hypothetical protein
MFTILLCQVKSFTVHRRKDLSHRLLVQLKVKKVVGLNIDDKLKEKEINHILVDPLNDEPISLSGKSKGVSKARRATTSKKVPKLEETIARVEQDIAETKERIRKAEADGDREYMMKLMDDLKEQREYLKELQKKENILLEQSRGTGK